jgi:hypothetical protein
VADTAEEAVAPSLDDLPESEPLISGNAPTMLYHKDFQGELVGVCTVMHTRIYKKNPEDPRDGYIGADEFIERQIRAGFHVMDVWIVRMDSPNEVQHGVMTVLVKLKDT